MAQKPQTEATGPWAGPYGIVERILIGLWACYTVLTFVFWGDGSPAYAFHLIVPAILVASVMIPPIALSLGPIAVDTGRIALILLTCFASYEWVAWIISVLPERSYELAMLQLDATIFGGNPSVWAQSLHSPALTEFFQIVYIAYFPTMLIVALALLVERKRKILLHYMLALLTAVIFNHVCYVLIPVRSPFLVAEMAPYSDWVSYAFPLKGLWYADSLREGLLTATNMRHDCFPSGHTLHSLIAIYFAWKANRLVSIVATFLGTSIVVSTLYLRYHYGVDLLVGALAAAFWITAAARMLSRSTDPSVDTEASPQEVSSLIPSE